MRVTGPESSGKSTLAQTLAWCLDGTYVAEQARAYLHALARPYTEADLALIWQAQQRAETAARQSGASYVICDTGPEVLQIWSEVKYGRCAATLSSQTATRSYDLTLLCAPDLAWTYDPLREHPNEADRWTLHARYRSLLPGALGITGADRVQQALSAIQDTSLH
ncbi:AAA family ATPase [Neolewinella maritima]|uniref:AAA family ATPase n=1 Tax=Neolewinella maritima TaxID=1383882 RepID=UPI001EE85E8C|nr:AAA family ATPase [Neolewinella maritima]